MHKSCKAGISTKLRRAAASAGVCVVVVGVVVLVVLVLVIVAYHARRMPEVKRTVATDKALTNKGV